MNKSALFKAYNAGRTQVREGVIDGPRLNRALGVAQASEARPYRTTTTSCTCADAFYRRAQCKHQLALILTGVTHE